MAKAITIGMGTLPAALSHYMMIHDIDNVAEDLLIFEIQHQLNHEVPLLILDFEETRFQEKHEVSFPNVLAIMHEEEIVLRSILQSSSEYPFKKVVTKTNAGSRKSPLWRFSTEMSRHPP